MDKSGKYGGGGVKKTKTPKGAGEALSTISPGLYMDFNNSGQGYD